MSKSPSGRRWAVWLTRFTSQRCRVGCCINPVSTSINPCSAGGSFETLESGELLAPIAAGDKSRAVARFHRGSHGWALGGVTGNIQRLRIDAEYLGRPFDQRRPV